jgi:PTH1 family peptidyl-tRNA hydrolase
MRTRPKLLIGLGNPGMEYENTYHNAGVAALDAAASDLSGGNALHWKSYRNLFAYAQIGNWIFAKPITFMNDSGIAVREAARKFNVLPEDIVLLHDDSDLPLGTWKISRARGAAGHHGAESAIAALGTNSFARIRIGIRPTDERTRSKAGSFVLRKVTKGAAAKLETVFRAITEELKGLADLP